MVLTETGLAKVLQRVKSFIASQLNSKASAIHTHTTSDISNLAENWNVTGTNLDISFAGSSNNNGQLSIQINGTDITTFMANQITNSTFNLNFNSFGYNLIPSANETYNLGSATNNYNTVYTRNINHGLSSSSLILSGGNEASNGSNLVLYGTDRSDGFQGIWQLTARGTNSYYLRGNANGSITTSATLIRPTSDSGCNLGSDSYRIGNITTNSLAIKDVYPAIYFKTGGSSNINSYIQDTGTSTYSSLAIRVINPSVNSYNFTSLGFFNEQSVSLGLAEYRWGQIYSTNSAISTSDERQKDNIKQIDDKLLQAWGNVNIVQFNFKDALEKKGENARLHTGYIAQNIQQACEENGINPNDYGLFCFDSWEEQEEKKDENGQVIEPYRAKGDLYSLRYEEALVVECAYLRKQIELLQERLNKLEEK